MRPSLAALAVLCATSCAPSSGASSTNVEPTKSEAAATPRTDEPAPPQTPPPTAAAPVEVPSAPDTRRLRAADPEPLAVALAADAAMNFPFIFHGLGDHTLVSTRNRIAPLPAEGAELAWSSADVSDALAPGHYGGMQVELVGGRWPDQVVGVLADIRPRMDSVRKYVRWSDGAWVPWRVAPAEQGVYVAFASPSKGALVGLQHVNMWSGNGEGFEPRIDVFPAARSPVVPDGYIPVSLAVGQDGRLYGVASEPDDHRARLVVWKPGGGAPDSLSTLPEVAGFAPRAGDVRVLVASDGPGVVVAGGVGGEGDWAWVPYVASHVDGKWAVVRTPDEVRGIVGSVAHGSGGSLWLTTSSRHGPVNSRWVAGRGDVPLVGQLWRADDDDELHELRIELDRKPNGAPPSGFGPRTVARSGNRMWVAMEIDAEITDMGWLNRPCHLLATAEL